ncbi:hypothetical protein EJ110_NYTH03063 [Nymphaea thermarum]|nr:hypothetical protein EJ110_NYTH03063 [Nymphaea thermarum]
MTAKPNGDMGWVRNRGSYWKMRMEVPWVPWFCCKTRCTWSHGITSKTQCWKVAPPSTGPTE